MSLVVLPSPRPETVADHIRRLQAEVRALSAEQVQAMRADVLAGIETAREVALNPAQLEGVRQLAEKVVRDGESLVLTLDQITARAK
jgi:hypothetical protein